MLAKVVYVHIICEILQWLGYSIIVLRLYHYLENELRFLLHFDLQIHNKNVRRELILMKQLGADCSLYFGRVSNKPNFSRSDGLPTLDYSDIDR